jgi:hypothetical protein
MSSFEFGKLAGFQLVAKFQSEEFPTQVLIAAFRFSEAEIEIDIIKLNRKK